MRVLFVYPSTYPWDVRVEKIATSLREQGHGVHLLSANFDRREAREELNGIVVHRLPRLPRWAGPLQVAVSLPSPCNPVWFFAMRYLLGRQRFDVMIVRDLQVALAAIAAGRLAGVPVVLDLAENWPALLREWRHHEGWTLQNLLLRHPSPAGIIERLSVRHADHVIVVVEEMRDRLASELHVHPARISVVMNTPTYRSYVQREKAGDRLVLVYLGEVHASRGLELAIRALALVLRRSGRARLRIIGRGKPAQERRLRDLAEKLGVLKEVEFVEWMPQEEALRVAGEADIGLCPFPASALNDTTISNKLFEYMCLGLPVICSDVRPAKRIIGETGAGVVYPAGSAEGLCAAILRLRHPPLRVSFTSNARRAVEQRYRWDVDAAVLHDALNGVVARHLEECNLRCST